MKTFGLPSKDKVQGLAYKDAPIAHYPNWAFRCPDCPPEDSYYELPQDLPAVSDAYENRTLSFLRKCGCVQGTIDPLTLRMKDVM